MNNLKISSISNLDLYSIQKIISAQHLSDAEKKQFLIKNSKEITRLVDGRISAGDFSKMMKNRPLQKFKFIKNSFTKKGDKILLAKALEIEPAEVNDYIHNVNESLKKVDNLDFLPKDTVDKIKTYVFRHGSLDQVVSFLDYELKTAKDITKEIFRTLDYNNEGVANYFKRPIHRMTNHALVQIYNTIDKNMDDLKNSGKLSEADKQQTAEWAFIQLCKIKDNQKIINAIKTYKTLK